MLEIFGYIASVIVAISLMMSNVWRLRWLNMFGAGALMSYGLLIDALPVACVNGFIVLVDAYYIWELHSRKDLFTLLDVSSRDEKLLSVFFDRYGDDARKFFPEFDLSTIAAPHYFLILRNLMPVGLFVCEDEGNGTARIHLDYVIPSHRDLANAHFFYNSNFRKFLKAGFSEFIIRGATPKHEQYSRKMGFMPSLFDPEVLVKTLAAGSDMAKVPMQALASTGQD